MPFETALARAGTFEALLPYLRRGRIIARCEGVYSWPSGEEKSGPRDIPPEWWVNARIDYATGRVVLTPPGAWIIAPGQTPRQSFFEVFAIGIGLEAAAVEALFSVAPVSEPTASPVEPGVAKKHAGGSDPQHDWDAAARYVDEWVATHGPLQRRKNGEPIIAGAIGVMTEWFEKKKLSVPQRNTFYRWFKTHPAPERWFVT